MRALMVAMDFVGAVSVFVVVVAFYAAAPTPVHPLVWTLMGGCAWSIWRVLDRRGRAYKEGS